VDPTDFFKTAELLKTHVEEAHLRTSIGRSYYATFLYFREHLRSQGLEKKKQPSQDAHAFIIKCLQNSNVQEGKKASTRLHNLRQLRTDADYRLDKKLSQNDADDAFAKAKNVIDDYTNNITPEQETQLIQNASDFAIKIKSWM